MSLSSCRRTEVGINKPLVPEQSLPVFPFVCIYICLCVKREKTLNYLVIINEKSIALRWYGYFPEHYRFYGNRNELRDFSLVTHNNESFLFAALRRFLLGAARLVVVRLVGCLRRNGLARCWNGSVSLDMWGKYSRPPCSFVCLVFGESRRYLHWCDQRWNGSLSRAKWLSDRHSKFLWCLWEACWMYLIHIQLGFLGLKYIRRKESIN